MTLQEVCCQRIQELCDERNISMNKLSILCGMTQSTLSNITSGRSKNPTVPLEGVRIQLFPQSKRFVMVWISH